jgi:transposase
MLHLAAGTQVYLAAAPVDLRRGHDGLVALVRSLFGMDPLHGHVFVFLGRRVDRVKVLFWDRGGFVVYYKRLARGRFKMPEVSATDTRVVLDSTELAMLLGGFDLRSARRVDAWSPRSSASKVA